MVLNATGKLPQQGTTNVLIQTLGAQDTNIQDQIQKSQQVDTVGIQEIIDYTKFSSLNNLVRVTEWISRFIARARKFTTHTDVLDLQELKDAKMGWIESCQLETCHKALYTLKSAVENNLMLA